MNIHINMSRLSTWAGPVGPCSLSNRLGLTDTIFQRVKEKKENKNSSSVLQFHPSFIFRLY